MESQALPTSSNASFRMSWTAYIGPVSLFFVILLFLGAPAFAISTAVGWIFLVIILAFLIIRIMTIRSVILFTDDQGVWVFSGIFPWSKGTRGVKWRDLEDAVYFPNFFSWILKSYTVRIGHRFTKSSEIVLKHMALGHSAAIHINEYHANVLASGKMA